MPVAALALGGVGSIVGGIFGANSANKAANAQVQAANHAADLQHQDAQAALDFQRQIFGTQQQNIAPWLQAGRGALGNLSYLLGIGDRSQSPFGRDWNFPSANNVNFPNAANPNVPTGQSSISALSPNGVPSGVMPTVSNMQPTAAGGDIPNPASMSAIPNPASIQNPASTNAAAPGQMPPNAAEPIPAGAVPTGAPISNMSALSGQTGNAPAFGGGPTTQGASGVATGDQKGPPTGGGLIGGGPGLTGDPTFTGGGQNKDGGPTVDPGTGATATGTPGTPQPDSGNPNDPFSGLNFGSLLAGYGKQFVAPTNVTEQNDPGFQFRLQEGQKALENSAAARGGVLGGGTAKALQRYGQDYGSNEYGNVYNRSLTEYQQGYNQFQQQQANVFNRLSALSGGGQVAAGELNSAAGSTANNVGNILMTSGNQIGQNLNNAGAARASGYVGAGNAYSNAFSNLGGLASIYALMNQNQSSSGGGNV